MPAICARRLAQAGAELQLHVLHLPYPYVTVRRRRLRLLQVAQARATDGTPAHGMLLLPHEPRPRVLRVSRLN